MRSLLLIFYICCSMATMIALSSCQKTFDPKVAEQTSFDNSSIIQVYMAMVNANRNYVYVDAQPINGASITSGTVFPAVTPGAKIQSGVRAFLVRDTLRTTTQVPLSFGENMDIGRNYTIFVYDTISAPKQRTVETPIVIPPDNTARIRFANFVYSPTAIPAVDIFSVKKNANIFTNVQISEATGFISYPVDVTDTFYIRSTGTGVNLQNFDRNPVATGGTLVNIIATLTPRAKRSYTLVFRGGYRSSNIQNLTTPFAANPHLRTLTSFTNY